MKRYSFGALCAFNLDSGGGDGGGTPAAAGAPQNLSQAAEAVAAAAGGQQGNEQPPSGQQNGQQPPTNVQQGNAQAYHPEGLADAFKGATDKETIDKLAGELAKQPKPPASPKDYTFSPGEDFIKKHGDLKDDPVLPLWREVAHELGVDQKTFEQAVPKLYDKLEKAGLIEPPIDWMKEVGKLEPSSGDPKERSIKAMQRVKAVESQLDGLVSRGLISKDDRAIASIAYFNADHVKTFEKIFALIPQQVGSQGGGQPQQSQATDHERAMRALFPSMVTPS